MGYILYNLVVVYYTRYTLYCNIPRDIQKDVHWNTIYGSKRLKTNVHHQVNG